MVEIDQDAIDKLNAEKAKKVKKAKKQDDITSKLVKHVATQTIQINNAGKTLFYWYEKQKGIWVLDNKRAYLNKLINEGILNSGAEWTSTDQKSIYLLLDSSLGTKQKTDTFDKVPVGLFNFKNGIYDLNNNKLLPHSSKYYFTTCVPYNIATELKDTPETDKYFDLFFGDDKQTMMEFIGYCFYASYEPIQCFIILLGNGGDGKSWFISNYLTKIIGEDNTSNIQLNELANDKDINFKNSELYHKYLNAGNELSSNDNKPINTAKLKMLTGGDNSNTSVKNQSDVRFSNYAKMIFTTNELPTFRDISEGFNRRANVIQVHKIKDFKNIINRKKLNDEMESFVFKCIQAFKELLNNGTDKLTMSKENKKLVADWLLNNDKVQQFLNDETVEVLNSYVKALDMFQAFEEWCKRNKYQPLGRNTFYSALARKGIKKSEYHNGKHIRGYEGMGLNPDAINPYNRNNVMKIVRQG